MSSYNLYFDGSCGPTNPGPFAGYGVVIKKDGMPFYTASGPLTGQLFSNNYAEFYALYKGLEYLAPLMSTSDKLFIRGDSQLVINIMNKKWRGKAGIYYPAYKKALEVLTSIRNKQSYVSIDWVPREYNTEADKLSTDY